ncbi:MAG: PhoH family protein [Gammaproteobacteria bacterium]
MLEEVVSADLKDKIETAEFTLTPSDNRRLMSLCGRFDEHLRQIERRMHIEINNRGSHFQLIGAEEKVKAAQTLLTQLYAETKSKEELTPAKVHLYLQQAEKKFDAKSIPEIVLPNEIAIRTRRAVVKARGETQTDYVRNIQSHSISFGIGPAGTGKTYLAVACAVQALEAEQVARVLLVRPAVEAGEKLGFLPGDISEKINPYLRPLYDALYEMIGFERLNKLLERQIVEVAPLAYMRGRTLNDAFIILDESQNTTPEQMKMFLTRIGFNSTVVVTGDITQIDLPKHQTSGLVQAIHILKGVKGLSFTYFKPSDVVRHPLVQGIIEAYDRFDAKHNPRRGDK